MPRPITPEELDAHALWCKTERAEGKNLVRNGADMSFLDLRRASLRQATIINSNLKHSDFRGADLTDAKLSESDLMWTNFSGANLSGASLWDSDLTGANLSGANLSGANLSLANLRGADLTGADLTDASLYDTIGNGKEINTAEFDRHFVVWISTPREKDILQIDTWRHPLSTWKDFRIAERMHILQEDLHIMEFWMKYGDIIINLVERCPAVPCISFSYQYGG